MMKNILAPPADSQRPDRKLLLRCGDRVMTVQERGFHLQVSYFHVPREESLEENALNWTQLIIISAFSMISPHSLATAGNALPLTVQ